MAVEGPEGARGGASIDRGELYRVLFEQRAIGVVLVDQASARFVDVNERFAQMLGFERAELIGRTWLDVTFEEDRAADQAAVLRMCETGQSVRRDKRYRCKDGGESWGSLTVIPLVQPGRPDASIALIEDLRDRRADEARTRALREQLTLIADSFPGVLFSFEIDVDGRPRMPFATPGIMEVLGLRAEEVAHDMSAWSARVHPDDLPTSFARLQSSIRARAPWHGMFRYQHPSRGLRWIEGWSRPVAGAENPLVYHGVLTDVTDHQAALQALVESESRYRAMFELAAVGIAEVDLSSRRYHRVNDKLCEIIGYTRDELMQKTWAEITHPDDLDEQAQTIEAQVKAGTTGVRHKRYLRKDGSIVWVDLSVASLGGGHAVTVIVDATTRMRAEAVLRESERRLRVLLEKASDVLIVLDHALRVTLWSPSATAHLGWTPEEALGRTDFELVHADDQGSSQILQALVTTPGGSARFVRRQLHKDGSQTLVEVTARNLLHDEAVAGIVLNLHDITERTRLTEQFQQSQKLESIGRLAGGVAHDFNNLLTVILTSCEALEEDMEGGVAPSADDVEQIHAAAERARELTRQLLAFARKQVIDPVVVDLNSVVRGSQKMLARLIGEDVELRVDLQAGLWSARADLGQLEQVIVNLAVNARDAMPRGGRLSLLTRNVALIAGTSELGSGDWVRLEVQDTGTGMSPEVQRHIFEPFFTTKPQGKGTGLGLSTVYGIVRQAGGHVEVESELGRGTRFAISLPRVAKAMPALAHHPTPLGALGTETILLAEDDQQVQTLVVRALRRAGYQVIVASNGFEALAAVTRDDLKVDLVLTDVVMPGLDGRRLVEEMRVRIPDVKVLFISGYTDDVFGEHGVLEEGVDLLSKPFTTATLLDRVRRALDRRPA